MIEKWINRILGAVFMWLWALLAGCTLHHVIDFGNPAPDPQVILWQQKVTDELNQHENRIRELEKEHDDGTAAFGA